MILGLLPHLLSIQFERNGSVPWLRSICSHSCSYCQSLSYYEKWNPGTLSHLSRSPNWEHLIGCTKLCSLIFQDKESFSILVLCWKISSLLSDRVSFIYVLNFLRKMLVLIMFMLNIKWCIFFLFVLVFVSLWILLGDYYLQKFQCLFMLSAISCPVIFMLFFILVVSHLIINREAEPWRTSFSELRTRFLFWFFPQWSFYFKLLILFFTWLTA